MTPNAKTIMTPNAKTRSQDPESVEVVEKLRSLYNDGLDGRLTDRTLWKLYLLSGRDLKRTEGAIDAKLAAAPFSQPVPPFSHTPTPWSLATDSTTRGGTPTGKAVLHAEAVVIATLASFNTKNGETMPRDANGTFIIRACNTHHEMQACLQDITQRFEDLLGPGVNGEIEGDREAIAKARMALAAAERSEE